MLTYVYGSYVVEVVVILIDVVIMHWLDMFSEE